MMRSHTRVVAPVILILFCSLPAFAQLGGEDGGDVGTGVQTGGTDTGTGNGLGGGAFTQLDADAAFSAIERGETVGASENTGQGFSEASAASGSGMGGLGGLGGLGGGFGGLGGPGGFGSLFGGGAAAAQQTTKPIIRTKLRSAINIAPIPPQQRQRLVSARFRNLPSRSPLRGLNVSVVGQTAVITGVVRNDHDRRMSELLLRLEPGIRDVDNQVVVAQ